MKLTVLRRHKRITIRNEKQHIVVTFPAGEDGEAAFECFFYGLATKPDASLFDYNKGEFVIGGRLVP